MVGRLEWVQASTLATNTGLQLCRVAANGDGACATKGWCIAVWMNKGWCIAVWMNECIDEQIQEAHAGSYASGRSSSAPDPSMPPAAVELVGAAAAPEVGAAVAPPDAV